MKFLVKVVRRFEKSLKRFYITTSYILNLWRSTKKNSKLGIYSPRFFFSNKLSFTRIMQAHEKETLTLDWINKMNPGEIFWDIGANIGVFCFTAASRGMKVVAFEPHFANFYELNKTLQKNSELSSNIILLPIAVTESDGINRLSMESSCAGYSGVQMEQRSGEFDFASWIFSLGLSPTFLATTMPPEFGHPQHIKIDVDGLDYSILHALRSIVSDNRTKSVLVESQNEQERNKITSFMRECGFGVWGMQKTIPGKTQSTIVNLIFWRF